MRQVLKQLRTPIEIPANVMGTAACRLVSLSVIPDHRYQKPTLSGKRPQLGELIVRDEIPKHMYSRDEGDRIERYRADIIALMDMSSGLGRMPDAFDGERSLSAAQEALINRVFDLSQSTTQGDFAARLLEFLDFAQGRISTALPLNLTIRKNCEIFVEGGEQVLVNLQLSD